MCGIAVLAGRGPDPARLDAMIARQSHRGPDATGRWLSPSGLVGLGHDRLAVIDPTEAGLQPMADATGRYRIVFNGMIYNYVELRVELAGKHRFRSRTDTEVLLAAYAEWGEACLDRLIGMFAFAIWDESERRLFAARDRFGVKPLFCHETPEGGLWLASEIKALQAAGVAADPDPATWAAYLTTGLYDHDEATFWRGITRLPPGGCLVWDSQRGARRRTWYDPAEAVRGRGEDDREDAVVEQELAALLEESVRLRFRSDVPVGLCLSGGLDSSLLLALVDRIFGSDSRVTTYTFHCGDPAYDETTWVERMLAGTRHPARFCRLRPDEVPELAEAVADSQDEPFGGIPTLGMAKVHERARSEGVVVLLDGNGMDEGWAGYDYYGRADRVDLARGPVQGTPTGSEEEGRGCLAPEFAARARPFRFAGPFGDPLRDLQYRDIRYTKIPRAMRFADRVSMMYGRELREPFLDHRVVELGLAQPAERKIADGRGKWLPRQVARGLLAGEVREAPKRPVQTPQREWLRGPLAGWAEGRIEAGLDAYGGVWLDREAVRRAWRGYRDGAGDSSFFVWQWISLGLMLEARAARSRPSPVADRGGASRRVSGSSP